MLFQHCFLKCFDKSLFSNFSIKFILHASAIYGKEVAPLIYLILKQFLKVKEIAAPPKKNRFSSSGHL